MNKGFSELGLAFAESFEDVELAREVFEDERRELLMALHQQLERAIQHEFKGKLELRVGCIDAWMKGQYLAATEKQEGRARASGLSILLRPYGGFFGFQTTIWFALTQSNFKRYLERPTGLANELGMGREEPVTFYEEMAGHIRIAAIQPSERQRFNFEVFVGEAARLPDLFIKADQWMANVLQHKA